MRSLLTLAFAAAATVAPVAHADDHVGLGHLVGEHLNLVYADHTVSGAVGDLPLYATPLADEFGIKLVHRAGGQDFEATLRQTDGVLGTTVTTAAADGAAPKEVAIKFTKVSGADGTVEGTLDADAFKVVITSDTMDGNHYVDPRFDVTVGETAYHFQLEGGSACIGCSTKITFVVLSMLRATGKL
jgi:hypothetical protein